MIWTKAPNADIQLTNLTKSYGDVKAVRGIEVMRHNAKWGLLHQWDESRLCRELRFT